MKTTLKIFGGALMMLALATACSEEEDALQASLDVTAQEDLAALEEELIVNEEWADRLDEMQFGRYAEGDDDQFTPPDCAVRTWEHDSANMTRTLTIDFGDEPCLGRDGLYRRGMITITFQGPRQQPGSSRTTEYIGYFVMDNQYNGTVQTVNQGNHVRTRTVNMTWQRGPQTASWQGEREIEMIAGYNTPERFDDLFLVTGSGQGVRRNGTAYTSEIQEPLLRKMQPGCHRHFVDGTILFTDEDGTETLLDYDPVGGAPCDRLASVTRNGETRLITLR